MMTARHGVLVLAAMFCALAVREGVMPLARPAATVVWTGPMKKVRGAAVPADPGGLIATIVARPLLRPDRRPLARAAGTLVRRSAPRLSGILVAHGVRVAMFADPGGRTVMRAEGGTIGRYRVVRIAAGVVTLGVGSKRIRLTPRFAKLAGRVAPAPAPAPLTLETPGRQ